MIVNSVRIFSKYFTGFLGVILHLHFFETQHRLELSTLFLKCTLLIFLSVHCSIVAKLPVTHSHVFGGLYNCF